MFESRILHVLMNSEEQGLAALKGMGKLTQNPGLEISGYFGAWAAILDLAGEVRDINTLFQNRALLVKSLKLASNPKYVHWLQETKEMHNALIAFGSLRAMAIGYQVKGAVEGVQIKSGLLKGLKGLQPMLKPEDWAWLKQEVIKGLDAIEPAFFADSQNGLLAKSNGDHRDYHQEWLDHVEQQETAARIKRYRIKTEKTANDLRADLAKIKQAWQQRVAEFAAYVVVEKAKYPMRYTPPTPQQHAATLRGRAIESALPLEKEVDSFLSYLEGEMALVFPNSSSNSLLWPRAYVIKDVIKGVEIIYHIEIALFESRALEQIRSIYE